MDEQMEKLEKMCSRVSEILEQINEVRSIDGWCSDHEVVDLRLQGTNGSWSANVTMRKHQVGDLVSFLLSSFRVELQDAKVHLHNLLASEV